MKMTLHCHVYASPAHKPSDAMTSHSSFSTSRAISKTSGVGTTGGSARVASLASGSSERSSRWCHEWRRTHKVAKTKVEGNREEGRKKREGGERGKK